MPRRSATLGSFTDNSATLDLDYGWGDQPMPLRHSYSGSFGELGSSQQQGAADVWSVVLEELSI